MGPASISQEYKSTPTICHNRTTVVKASVPSTGIAANFEVFDDFINLLLEKKKKSSAQLFWDFPESHFWQHGIPKMTNRKSAQKFNVQNTDYLQKCRNLKNPKTAATIALSTAKPTNSVLTDDI